MRVPLEALPLQEFALIVHITKPLFAWDELESSPTLATLRAALEAIPDAPLLAALNARRHRGCDKDPVSVLGVHTAGDSTARKGPRVPHGIRRAALIVPLACATLLSKAQRKEGTFGTRRQSPIAQKLHELTAEARNATLK